MRKFGMWATFGLATVISSTLLFSGPVSAQKKDAPARTATVHALMEGLVVVNCKALGGELKKESPDWKKATQYAELLNESGFLLMANKRCKSGDWAKACATMKGCAAKCTECCKECDAEGAQAAFKGVTGACAACHKVHKKKS